MTIRRRSILRPVAWLTLALLCAFPGTALGQSSTGPANASAERQPTRLRAVDAERARTLLKARLEQSFAFGDFNRDGIEDAAIANFLADHINVRLGQANGTFAAPVAVPTGRGPRALATADFDGDNALDLAVAEFFAGSVRVFRGRGDGRFTESRVIPVAPWLTGLTAGDFDGDGRTDVAVASAQTGRIVILRNSSSGAWTQTSVGRTRRPTLLLSADVNQDGSPDVVAVDAESSEAHVFAGRSAGEFEPARTTDVMRVVPGAKRAASAAATGQDAGRIVKMTGDGQAAEGGRVSPEPLIVEVKDLAGEPSAGETVLFSVLAGEAGLVDPARQEPRDADARLTDDHGHATAELILPSLPDASVVTATLPVEQAATFGVVSIVEYDVIVEAVMVRIIQQVRDPDVVARHRALLSSALDHLNAGDALTAVREVSTSLDLIEQQPAVLNAETESGAAELERRLINQVLLAGVSPELAEDRPILCDTPIRTTLPAPTEVDRFTFPGIANEVVHITLANEGGTAFNPVFRVIAPDRTVVPGCGFSTNLDCRLPLAGSYAVEVLDASADGTGTYSLHIQRLTDGRRCGGSIACDVPLTTTLGTVAKADTNIHSFSAAAGERVHVTLGNQGGTLFNPVFRVIAPNGTVVPGCGFSTNLDCLLPLAGSYAVEVLDGSTDGTGTYSLHIQRLTDGRRCGGSIACDVPLTTTLGTLAKADTNIHSFSAAASERVHVTLGNQGGTLFNPVFRVIAPNGAVVPGCGFSTNLDCLLPLAGSYAVEVLDGSTDGTGTYSLHIQRLTDGRRCGGSIACDVPLTTTLGTVAKADTNIHSFSAAANERVHVTLGNQGGTLFNPVFRVIAPSGAVVPGCGFSTNLDCLLPLAGSYAVEVLDGSTDGTGTYSLHIQRLTEGRRCGGSIACDVPRTTTLGTVAKADTNIHSFSAAANERVHVTLGNQGGTLFNPVFRVIAPSGAVVPGCGFSTNLDCLLPLAGSYAVEVLDGSTDGAGTYSVHVQRLTAGRRCGGSIECDVPLTTTLGTVAKADTNIHSFSAAANERMHVVVANHGGTLFNPVFRVIAPNGTVVPGCGFSTNLDCLLPLAGSYAVEVLDGSTDGTGTYSLHIQRLTANWRCMGQARCGVPVRPAALGGVARADTDLWSFGAVAGTVRITFGNLGGTNFNPIWRVVAPNGTTVAACGFTSRLLADCVLPAAGAYAVQVLDGSFDGTGRYEVTVAGAACRGLPNVTVSSLTCGAPTAPGSSITVNVRTANVGDAAAPASTTGVYLSLDNAFGGDTTLLPKISVPALAAGASALVPVVVTIPAGTAPGKDFILAQADDPHVIPEGNEMNNIRACPLTIGPDLVVSSVVAPASAVRGATVVAAITVRNLGGAASAASTVRLHFSTDNVVSASDVATNVQVIGLGPNQAATVNATITIPSTTPVGTRFLIAVADALGIVREADERNNGLSRAIAVQ